jgi:nucleotide-binding universal stress UspA family protein
MTYELLLPLIALMWVTIGLGLGAFMRRRGHDGFAWFVMGALMGPAGILFAIVSTAGRPSREPTVVSPGTPRRGGSAVLVGVDGSPGSAAAVAAATRLFGARPTRITLAAVVPDDGGEDATRRATEVLTHEAEVIVGLQPAMELVSGEYLRPELVILRGRPSDALTAAASDGGYDLLVVGSRGAGLSRAVLGSVAEQLAGHCPVPVLVISPTGPARPRHDRSVVETRT